MKKLFFTGFLSAIVITNLLQAQINTKVNTNFENNLPEWMAEYNVPAVGVGIIEDGKIADEIQKEYMKNKEKIEKGG